MCGICGLAGPKLRSSTDLDFVRSMMAAIRHRGPDDEGLWADNHAVLGHLRLSIIDLEGGHQPLPNEDGSIMVVFNGEIYNHKLLRAELIAAGHVFRTRCDTEVLVHGYEEWGEALAGRLRGMFAFVLYDQRTHRLVAVRDRLGIKPLYYHVNAEGEFAFASEAKALFANGAIRPAFNRNRLGEYLVFRSVYGAETLFRDVFEVLPGTVLVYDILSGRTVQKEYWSPVTRASDVVWADDIIEEGREKLAVAVEMRLMSDVLLGTITSGGLDSSLVTALAARAAGGAFDTFCAGLDVQAFDERKYAKNLSDQLSLRFHDITVTAHSFAEQLPRLAWVHDEPLTHPNALAMSEVFRLARTDVGVKVLLSGEGADELFGGYGWYQMGLARELLRPARNLLKPLSFVLGAKGSTFRRISADNYLTYANAPTHPAEIQEVLGDFNYDLHLSREIVAPQTLNDLFIYDQRSYLPALLQRQDRMSMLHGLEARVPFLDHVLVDWANTLPGRLKTSLGNRKRLLKSIARPLLPRSIVDRKKVGFTLPLAQWLRGSDRLRESLHAMGSESSLVSGVFGQGRVGALVQNFLRGDDRHLDLVWSLLALELWAEAFLISDVRMEPLSVAEDSSYSAAGPPIE